VRYRVALLVTLVIIVVGIASMFRAKSAETARAGIDAIAFDTAGWRRDDASFSSMMWKRDDGDVLQLKWVPKFSDMEPEQDLESMRTEARRLASSKGGSLVSADVLEVAGRKAASLIYGRDPFSGREYVGMLFIRNRKDHFIFTMVATDRDGTGAPVATEAAVEELDALAPSHPVSRIRAFLSRLQQTVTFP
jgi:hypothetical protein